MNALDEGKAAGLVVSKPVGQTHLAGQTGVYGPPLLKRQWEWQGLSAEFHPDF
jgi:hypothetical protein